MEPIRNERLGAALDQALASNELGPLIDQLGRNSGLPGPRPNMEVAKAVGHAIAAAESKGERLVRDLAKLDAEFPRIVAAMALASRSMPSGAKKRPHTVIAAALAGLEELAEDPRFLVRMGIVEALRMRISAMGEPAVDDLATWTNGFLQAHVVLEALADKLILSVLPSAAPVMARLDEAFDLADDSPRAAERLQGVRVLREEMPKQIAIFASRYPAETVAWLEARAKSKRPETREVVSQAISRLRRSEISDAEALRLSALLTASGKPPRDPSRIVQGTRKRGRGRG